MSSFVCEKIPGRKFDSFREVREAIYQDMMKRGYPAGRAIYPVMQMKDGKPFMKCIVSNYGAVYCLRWWWEKVGEWTLINPKYWEGGEKE